MSHPAKMAALALQQAAKILDQLTEDQIVALNDGRGRLEFRMDDLVISPGRTGGSKPASSARAPKMTVATAAEKIRSMTGSEAVLAFLEENDKTFSMEELRDLAGTLGPTVSTVGRTKKAMRQNIVDGTTGFRERSAALLPGGWRE